METILNDPSKSRRHRGPHLGAVAIVFTVLFIAGLFPVTMFGGLPYFPGPWEPVNTMQHFFRLRAGSVAVCGFFHFGASVVLGIFTATVVSQLRFLGAKVAGTYIAFFGGILASANMAASAFLLYTLSHPGIADDGSLLQALYFIQYAFGGPGYSVPLGLLIAGVCVPAFFMKLLPRWLVLFGFLLAICGEASSLNLYFPQVLALIPLTRFPGFVWMICVGFMLPRRKAVL